MNRREFLYLVGGASAGGIGVWTTRDNGEVGDVLGDAQESVPGVGTDNDDDSDNMVQEFGHLSPGFEKIEFMNLGTLRIHFGGHNMDGFGVRHSSQDDIEDDVYVCEAPKSTGTQDIPLVESLRDQDAVYPSRQFKLVAYDGAFSKCNARSQVNVSKSTDGSVSFVIPESVAPASSFSDL